MNRQTITVDIAPGNSQVQRLSSAQGDIGRPLGVYIIQDGVALDCSGYTADLYILKSDGNYYEGTCTVDSQTNNLITWETAEQETPCAGVCAAQIRISANGEDIGTARFVEYVEASPGFVGEGSESTIDTIKGFVRQAEAWATGEKDGIPVPSTDPTYENNAKYYAEQSKQDYDDLSAEINDISEDVADLKTGMSDLEDAVSAQSIICDTPSSPIVTITDGADGQSMKSVTVDLELVQDLHGQEAPYPAGGGANRLPPMDAGTQNGVTIAVADDGTITINGTASTDTYFDKYFETSYAQGEQIYLCGFNPSAGDSRLTVFLIGSAGNAQVNLLSANAVYSAPSTADNTISRWRLRVPSGVTFTNFVCKPMLQIGRSAPTAFAPYSNVCPISGHTGVTVTRTGINIWDEEYEIGGLSNGDNITNSERIRSKNYIQIVPGTTYYLVVPSTYTGNFWLSYYTADKTFIRGSNTAGTTIATKNGTFTAPDNARFMRFQLTATATYGSDISINYPSTDTAYHAYQGETYEITLPSSAGTVYGGTLDPIKGKLTVDRVSYTIDETKNIQLATNSSGFLFYFTSGLSLKNNDTQITNQLTYATSGAASTMYAAENKFVAYAGGTLYFKFSSDINTVADVKAYLANNHLQMVLPLATPLTYTLTPTEITTLLGTNNVWADAGDVAISYQADTKLYIDKAGQTEDDTTANATISNGQYFQIGTTVYRATATILTGEQIIPGTNCEQTTTTEALNILMAGQSKAWELIREDTFTNASSADHTITTDANSQPFELTDAIMLFETPKQATASEVGSYGQIRFYPSTSGTTYYAAECGAWTQAASGSAHGIMGMLEQRDGLIFLIGTQQVTTSNSANMRMRYGSGFTGSSQGIWMASDFTIQRIVIPAVTGTGHYKLFGKRK